MYWISLFLKQCVHWNCCTAGTLVNCQYTKVLLNKVKLVLFVPISEKIVGVQSHRGAYISPFWSICSSIDLLTWKPNRMELVEIGKQKKVRSSWFLKLFTKEDHARELRKYPCHLFECITKWNLGGWTQLPRSSVLAYGWPRRSENGFVALLMAFGWLMGE